jgi:glycosyltransferase involved in cell wall biosynthesis
VVLFLGRITFQKGPDYFVEAAAKVIPHVPDVIFVMAGTGDMRQRMIDRVNELGLSQHFFFPGFLKGQEVEEMFSLADVYVMPSVSEPFGLSALEAIKFETPVIISRQSGVSEVLSHALKVDFWDTERLADLMINALQHEELRADLVAMAREEVRRLHWEASALRTIEVYRRLI